MAAPELIPHETTILGVGAWTFEHSVQAPSLNDMLMAEYSVDELLEPLRPYFGLANTPLEVIESIADKHGFRIEDVASVIIDIANLEDPIIKQERKLVVLTGDGDPVVEQFKDGIVGLAKPDTYIEVRPLPDNWYDQPHTADEWHYRTNVAEETAIFFTENAETLISSRTQSSFRLFDAAGDLELFLGYIDRCQFMAAQIEAREQKIIEQRAKTSDFLAILATPVWPKELADLDEEPFDWQAYEANKKRAQQKTLIGWRDISETMATPETKEALRQDCASEKRNIDVQASIAASRIYEAVKDSKRELATRLDKLYPTAASAYKRQFVPVVPITAETL